MNPLVYTPVIRALFRALDRWITDGSGAAAEPLSALADGTLTAVDASGWPAIPGFTRPQSPMTTYRLDFGPEWSKGIVTNEPPGIGKPFVGRVPAVDEAGNDRAGIRLPEIAVPLATHTGWNYRQPSIGAPDRLASEIGSYLPLPRTKADRERTGDGAQVDRRALREPRGLPRPHCRRGARAGRRALPAGRGCPGRHAPRREALRLGDAEVGEGPCQPGLKIVRQSGNVALAMGKRPSLVAVGILIACAVPAAGQFRRGIFSESTEIMLTPIAPPALLLPPGSVELQVRNSSTAPARVVDRVRELLARQLTDNDSRLSIVEKAGDVAIVATLTEWSESRRNSTKYVSEQRQVGTRQVTDKNGKTKTEPVYEYGRNKPSVVINASAGVRIEVRRRAGGSPVADETARHTIQEEHLVEAGPPTRDADRRPAPR